MRHNNITPTENDSPSSSPEYTTSEDEDASRESLGFSSIRLDNNDSSMGVGLAPGHQFPTNFAGIGIASNAAQLSSSLPSTSNADGILPQDSQQSTQSNNIGIGPRKRTFSTSESQPAGDKRTATKICRVCGDKAYSYNFNVITCESCKAFFRRNANKEKDIRYVDFKNVFELE
uniref:Nuclear receptor domain-containing protein n=1 Tax=Panagrolaimus superbus TaxID=310955 RepID=A0A914YC08_9BILA